MHRFQRIAVGLKDSPNGIAALKWAFREAVLRRCELEVIRVFTERYVPYSSHHIIAYPELDPQGEKDALSLCSKLVREHLDGEGLDLDPIIRTEQGAIADVLLDASVTADLLVLGASDGEHVLHRLLGSVVGKCLREARCCVVVACAQS